MTAYSMPAAHATYTLNGQDAGLFVHQAPALVKHTGTLAALAGSSPAGGVRGAGDRHLSHRGSGHRGATERGRTRPRAGHHANDDFRKEGRRTDQVSMADARPYNLTKLVRIWLVANALTHSEPNNPRTGEKGEHLTLQGAADAAAYVLDLRGIHRAEVCPAVIGAR